MNYKILITKIEYGAAEIEAESEEEAIEKAYELAEPYTYDDCLGGENDIDWHDNEVSDVVIDKS